MLSDALLARIEKIPGWLTKDEADFLHGCTKPPWCEIGAWMGRSTLVMADKGPGVVVDWFQGSPEHDPGTNTLNEFLAYTAGTPNITVIPKRFEDAVDDVGEDICTLHLDADHSYEATKRAFELYGPKVRPGGLVVMHDAWPNDVRSDPPWPGVYRFALELMRDPGWMYVGGIRSYAAFRRK